MCNYQYPSEMNFHDPVGDYKRAYARGQTLKPYYWSPDDMVINGLEGAQAQDWQRQQERAQAEEDWQRKQNV